MTDQEHPANDISSNALASKGSELCLACGLCCQGILHPWADLKENEESLAIELGLSVSTVKDNSLCFILPCPQHIDNRCAIFSKRPNVCGSYYCKLLIMLIKDSASINDSLLVVTEARKLITEIKNLLPAHDPSVRLGKQIRQNIDYVPITPQLHLKFTALQILLARYFYNEQEFPNQLKQYINIT